MWSTTLSTLTDNMMRRTVSLALAAVTLVASLGASCAISSVYAVTADAAVAPASATAPVSSPVTATTRFPSHCDMENMPSDPAAAAAMATAMDMSTSAPASGHWCAHKDRDDASGPSDGPAQPALVSSLIVGADLVSASPLAACAVVTGAVDPPPVTFTLPIRV